MLKVPRGAIRENKIISQEPRITVTGVSTHKGITAKEILIWEIFAIEVMKGMVDRISIKIEILIQIG